MATVTVTGAITAPVNTEDGMRELKGFQIEYLNTGDVQLSPSLLFLASTV